jgi:hypothetical protein
MDSLQKLLVTDFDNVGIAFYMPFSKELSGTADYLICFMIAITIL